MPGGCFLSVIYLVHICLLPLWPPGGAIEKKGRRDKDIGNWVFYAQQYSTADAAGKKIPPT